MVIFEDEIPDNIMLYFIIPFAVLLITILVSLVIIMISLNKKIKKLKKLKIKDNEINSEEIDKKNE